MALAGKVALVTGGAQGIGRAVAEALLQNAAKISVVDFNQEVGEQCVTSLDQEFGTDNCLFIQCDVTDREKLQDAFKRTVERFGKLDIVINNAGINNEKNWEKTIEVNLTSVVKGTYLGLEHMSKEHGKQGGVIINVSSMAAFLHSPHQPVYTATKYGVVGFTRAIAEASEIENYGVRINVLCPAFVDTPLLQSIDQEEKMGKFYKHKDEIKQRMDIYGILQLSFLPTPPLAPSAPPPPAD
ncbi:15-hydroxyprostaglandin dehydrogenase [NAD(+)] isoform X2 [Polyodon spathula]|uniref:15-hydroxyprostaglandin dehydrogenase [NAD(+)] isoform X2 n=1 Tax=Polyodon spathula TaxID=7913 RepID=UPI001B7EBA3C|nr:15-hydroxyprostaglandin dehydrogenase [NAD(+)] isoform X2 [Polyodon spathula]